MQRARPVVASVLLTACLLAAVPSCAEAQGLLAPQKGRPVAVGGVGLSDGTIHVDTTTVLYQMTGWEGVAQVCQNECGPGMQGLDDEAEDYPLWFRENYTDVLVAWLADSLKINRTRIEWNPMWESDTDYYTQFLNGTIDDNDGSGFPNIVDLVLESNSWVNDNADPNTISASGYQWSSLERTVDSLIVPWRTRLMELGDSLWIHLSLANGGTLTAYSEGPEEYAEFILAFHAKMMADYGFSFNSIEIINEPNDQSVIWDGTEIGQAAAAICDRMQALGKDPRIHYPSTSRLDNPGAPGPYSQHWSDAVAVEGATDCLFATTYHLYQNDNPGNRAKVDSIRREYGIVAGMLEHQGGTFDELVTHLEEANISAYQQFTLAYGAEHTDTRGAYLYVDTTGGAYDPPLVGERATTGQMSQFFRYVYLWADRDSIAMNQNASLKPFAFQNPNGLFSIVIDNTSGSTQSDVTVSGIRNGVYGVTWSDGTTSNIRVREEDVVVANCKTEPFTIPANATITLFQKTSSGTCNAP